VTRDEVNAAIARAEAAAKDHPPPWRLDIDEWNGVQVVAGILDSSRQEWRGADEKQGERVLETDGGHYNPRRPTAEFIAESIVDVPRMGARLLELEDHYARCAAACGIEYSADGHASEPGPIEDVERAIKQGARAIGEVVELKMALEDARVQARAPGVMLRLVKDGEVRGELLETAEMVGLPSEHFHALQRAAVLASRFLRHGNADMVMVSEALAKALANIDVPIQEDD
jgi:hypothetical protein